MIQVPGQKRPPLDRKEHVWVAKNLKPGQVAPGMAACWKCMLCGEVTFKPPPDLEWRDGRYCTPSDWRADRYEPLTEAERQLVPFKLR